MDTGKITAEAESIQRLVDEIIKILMVYGLDVLGAIALLVIGWVVAGWGQRTVSRLLHRAPRIDEMLVGFFSSITRYAILVFTVLAVLSQFGIETTSMIAVMGAAGFAIGLALQGTLSNVAAGVLLLVFRPFKIGDFVDAGGATGTVKAITLFFTEMATGDNIHIIVPNGAIWGSTIQNYSHHATRRHDLTIGIGYEDSIDAAIAGLKALVTGDPRVLADPEPMVVVSNLGDSSVDLLVRFWCNAGDYWPLKFDLTKAIKEKLDSAGINIPYPQTEVHMAQKASG